MATTERDTVGLTVLALTGFAIVVAVVAARLMSGEIEVYADADVADEHRG